VCALRNTTHNAVVALLKKLFDQAPSGLPSGQRPADLQVDWEGQLMAIVVSFRHPHGSWNVDSAVQAVAADEVNLHTCYDHNCHTLIISFNTRANEAERSEASQNNKMRRAMRIVHYLIFLSLNH